jgi:CRISPR type I-E-associated protein CasB/Cse2
VLSLLGQSSDPAAEQQTLLDTATTVLRRTWTDIATGCTDPLLLAQGTDRIEASILKLTGGKSVHAFQPLEKQVFAILNDIASHLTPDDKATLRTMLATEPPMLYWMLLGQVHSTLMSTPRTEAVWRAVLPALGAVRHNGLPVGRLLAQTDYPEMRMRQALTATGSTLVSLLTEIVRWLIAHEVSSVDVSSLATLGLADALGDRETLGTVRQRIALDYVRNRPRRQAA